jgi:hypothetical protein
MYMGWGNSDGSWTLSHRKATTEDTPAVVSGGSVSILTDISTKSDDATLPKTFAVKRPLSGSNLGDLSAVTDASQKNSVPFIYAICSTKPSGGASASIQEHDSPGDGGTGGKLFIPYSASALFHCLCLSVMTCLSAAVDFTKQFGTGGQTNGGGTTSTGNGNANPNPSNTDAGQQGGSSTAGGDTPTSSSDGQSSLQPSDEPSQSKDPLAYRKQVATAHAIIGGLAWVILSPCAVLLARLSRFAYSAEKRTFLWRPKHEVMQFLTLILTIVAVCLAIEIINSKQGIHFNGAHQSLGIFILFGLTLQLTLGWIIHSLVYTGSYMIRPGWIDKGRRKIQFVSRAPCLAYELIANSVIYSTSY